MAETQITDSKEVKVVRSYFFAGGGSGGHIYPTIAIARQIKKNDPHSKITFLCSSRPIDSSILSKTEFDFITLPAKGFSSRPDRFIRFLASQIRAFILARRILIPFSKNAVVIGCGGFASAPAVIAASKLKIPIAILNVDIIAGKANKFLSRFANRIFVQFAETKKYFPGFRGNIAVTGCPLREGFGNSNGQVVIDSLGLDRDKKTLVVLGGSSGSAGINHATREALEKIGKFLTTWQVIHISGKADNEKLRQSYEGINIAYRVVEYYDDIAELYAAAELVVGRGGAVSAAEYSTAKVASIVIPYPYHKDRHQYLNVKELAQSGGAVIVDEITDEPQRTAKMLAKELLTIMGDDQLRRQMAQSAGRLARPDAAKKIAEKLFY